MALNLYPFGKLGQSRRVEELLVLLPLISLPLILLALISLPLCRLTAKMQQESQKASIKSELGIDTDATQHVSIGCSVLKRH